MKIKNPPQPITRDSLTIRKHHLPHWQFGGSAYFVTFRSLRGELPAQAKQLLGQIILSHQGKEFDLWFGVIMPDHVHLLLRPREITQGKWYDLSSILKGIKGASSREINQLLKTRGSVWQKESFDRIVRDKKELDEKINYMINNPIAAGLVDSPAEYKFYLDGRGVLIK